ncbi:MAG: ankyrin repeat domain-containing protein [Gemmatimonadetes bacterium]|nr:ankyrin repeat domain-containing protein [Gemmatimonadota bacterium]
MERLLEAGADPNVRLEKTLWYLEYNFSRLSVEFAGSTPFWRAAYAQDVDAMRLLVEHGADPTIPTKRMPERRRRRYNDDENEDKSGLPPVPLYGPDAQPIHAAAGIGFGEGYAGGFHRGAPDGWLPAVKYLVEELGADVNARDANGFSPLHHAAARGDVEVIRFLVEKGADVTLVSRRGKTTADMANSPVQRVPVYPEALALLESLGAVNNHDCQVC